LNSEFRSSKMAAFQSAQGGCISVPADSWGNILRLGYNNESLWWLVLVPALAIFLTVTIFNLIGSGLRDAMDPRLRSTR
jgi:peptide/nickel transport system permease protein